MADLLCGVLVMFGSLNAIMSESVTVVWKCCTVRSLDEN